MLSVNPIALLDFDVYLTTRVNVKSTVNLKNLFRGILFKEVIFTFFVAMHIYLFCNFVIL